MNLTLKKAFYLGLIVIFLATIGVSVFYLLGGYDEVRVYKIEPIERSVAGKLFVGRYDDKKIQAFWDECTGIISNNEIDGILTTVNYKNDTLEKNEVIMFLGITLREEMAEIPQGFDVREYSSNERYAVFLSMHPLVRPWADTIEKMIRQKAGEEDAELEDFFFELHYQDNSLSVEGWVDY